MRARVLYEPHSGAGFVNPDREITDEPAPPITVGGSVSNAYHFAIETSTGAPPPMSADVDKPPYRVPLLAELRTPRRNAPVVASTFSGGGGSCLGYWIAGFRVAWANEFVPAAQQTYRANHPHTLLDERDIRTVTAAEILKALGLKAGELDLFDGSPPCQSFSTAGKRERGWGQVAAHGDGSNQRSDDLFFEYARLLKGLQPRAFIAENVSGLVKGKAKGYFKRIHAALVDCGYVVEARMIDAQWCGVPQARQRVIFQGVRADLELAPAWPDPLPYRYTVREALADITPGLVGQITGNDAFEPIFGGVDQPHPTVMAGGARTSGEILTDDYEGARARAGEAAVRPGQSIDEPANAVRAGRPLSIVEPEAYFAAEGVVPEMVDRLLPGESGSDHRSDGALYSLARLEWDKPAGTVQAAEGRTGVSTNQVHPVERRRLSIAELKRICSFPDDYVLEGTYSEQWARLGNSVPPMMMARIAEAVRKGVIAPARRAARQ